MSTHHRRARPPCGPAGRGPAVSAGRPGAGPRRPDLDRPGRRAGQRGGRRPVGPARGHRPGAVLDAAAGLPAVHRARCSALAWIKQAPCADGNWSGLDAVHAPLLLRRRPAVRRFTAWATGAVPYLDSPVEYPVLTGGFMEVAAAVAPRPTTAGAPATACCPDVPPVQSYYVVTCLLLSVCALVVTRAVLGLAGRRPWDAAMVGALPAAAGARLHQLGPVRRRAGHAGHVGLGAAAARCRPACCSGLGDRGEALPGAGARRAVRCCACGPGGCAPGCGRRVGRGAGLGWR